MVDSQILLKRSVFAVVIVAAVAAGITSCTSARQATLVDSPGVAAPPSSSTSAGSPGPTATVQAGAPGGVGHDPDSVADAVAAAMVTLDTRTDTSPLDAVHRATAWMTDDLAAELTGPTATSGAGWWTELAAHQGRTSAVVSAVEDSGQPDDTATSAYRVRWVDQVPVADDGWQHEPTGQVFFITMTRTEDEPWRVSAITTG